MSLAERGAARAILNTLLVDAGLVPEEWTAGTPAGGHTNSTSLLSSKDGGMLVFRRYGWPYGGEPDRKRGAKERWLHERLAACGVDVPRIHAASADGALMEFVDGELLGHLALRHDPLVDEAWATAGQMLRRAHDCPVPWDVPGRIDGVELEPFENGSWGDWLRFGSISNARSLVGIGRRIEVDRLDRVFAAAKRPLDAAPVGLLHNDAHVWNAIVAGEKVYWLDWEFAWAGDWVWDIARLDIFRSQDIGPTPPAFLAGYGRAADPLRYALCELNIYLWMATQAADGDTLLMPTYRAADQYLANLEERLDEIERILP